MRYVRLINYIRASIALPIALAKDYTRASIALPFHSGISGRQAALARWPMKLPPFARKLASLGQSALFFLFNYYSKIDPKWNAVILS
jgi:hypothetical protein